MTDSDGIRSSHLRADATAGPGRPVPATDIAGLDDPLRQFTGYHIRRAYNALRADLAQRLKPLGLRISTYSCLLLITQNPGIRQTELSGALDIERPNLVAILEELQRSGWIQRERMASDRRAFALSATPLGKRICKKAVLANRQNEEKILAAFSDRQVDTLMAALRKIEASG